MSVDSRRRENGATDTFNDGTLEAIRALRKNRDRGSHLPM